MPNDRLLYINSLSNYPRKVIKQISNSIQDRLSKNFSDEDILQNELWTMIYELWQQHKKLETMEMSET